jgi:hypothetical protein
MNENDTTQEVEQTGEESIEIEVPAEESAEETQDETKPTEPLQIDYKAKAEELQKKIAADAFKFRKEKRKEDGDSNNGDELDLDKPMTAAEVQKLLKEQEQNLTKQLSSKEALNLANTLTTNADEAAYAVSLWQHVTLPFDSMEEQIEFIVGGMNAKRILAQNAELKRTIISKDTAKKTVANTTRTPLSAGQPKVAPQVLAALKNTGFTYNSSQKVFSKKLANGKMMFNDGKGKTWVA